MSARRAGAPAARGGRPWLDHALLALLLLAFWFVAYRHTLAFPFVNDDYVFLDKVRRAGFLELWLPRDLAFGWWRPWSREFHYWWLDRAFGASERAAHVASVALWLAVMQLFLALARRLAGRRAAWIAVACVTPLAPWGALLSWVANAQDLWMLGFAFAALLLLLAGRPGAAAFAQLLALASKETAALVPALGFAALAIAGIGGMRERLRRLAPALGITVLWLAAHPAVRALLLRSGAGAPAPVERPPLATVLVKTLAAPFNLESLPRPDLPWPAVLALGLAAAVPLAAMVALGARSAREPAPAKTLAGCGAWALLGSLPLLAPGIGWHAYYGLLGLMGLWLGLATLLARRPALAMIVVALLALGRQALASTPSWDWGTEWYQSRAGWFLSALRADLRRLHPELPGGSRLFFVQLPNNIGLLTGDGPAVRVWYRDTTLRAHYYSAYRARGAAETRGADFFFRFDSTRGLVEVTKGDEPVAASRAANPRWQRDHEVLGALFLNHGEFPAALAEYRKLAAAFPGDETYPLAAAALLQGLGRETEADSALRGIARRFGGLDSTRALARDLLRVFRSEAGTEPRP